MSVKTTSSLTADFVRFDTDIFMAAVKASSIASVLERVDTANDDIDLWWDVALIAADQTTFDALVGAHGLLCTKRKKIRDINAATDAIAAASGIEYPTSSGVHYSLSSTARQKWLGVEAGKADLSYPFDINSIDGMASVSIVGSTEAHTFFLTALGTYQAHLDSGTVLQTTVRDATTIAAVEAVDPYDRS